MASVSPSALFMAEGHTPVWVDMRVDTWVVYTGNCAAMSIQVQAPLWVRLSVPWAHERSLCLT